MSQFVAERAPCRVPSPLPEPAPDPVDQPRKRLIPQEPALDGIRGIAVAAVLCFHAGFSWATGGFLGVSTFFTLSGFLITTLLLRERIVTGRLRLGAFWIRRFRRLMPAALVRCRPRRALRVLRGHARAADFAAAATCSARSGTWRTGGSCSRDSPTPSSSPIRRRSQHFWSLAIEEQFYLVYPLVVGGVVLLTRGRPRVLARAPRRCSLALSVVADGHALRPGRHVARVLRHRHARSRVARRRLPGRAPRPEVPHRVAARCGTRWSGSALPRVDVHGRRRGSRPIRPRPGSSRAGSASTRIGSAAIIAAAVQPGPVRALLSPKPLRFLGRVSYGVYLFHWPVFLWLDAERTGLDPWPLFGLRVAVTLGLATASYYLVEQPIRTGRRLTSWRPLVVAPEPVLVVAIGLVVVTTDPPQPAISFAAPPSARRAFVRRPAAARAPAAGTRRDDGDRRRRSRLRSSRHHRSRPGRRHGCSSPATRRPTCSASASPSGAATPAASPCATVGTSAAG